MTDREGRRGYSAPARVTLVGQDAYILSSLHEAAMAEVRAENERLRETLTHAAQALSGCVCSMAEADLMAEIAASLDENGAST